MDWFLYETDLRHERVNYCADPLHKSICESAWKKCDDFVILEIISGVARPPANI